MKNVTQVMERALDGAWARHEVLAENVANSETPGYKRQDLNFLGVLQDALGSRVSLSTSDTKHLSSTQNAGFRVVEDRTNISADGNGVDIDLEMGEVSSNALYYDAIARQLSSQLSLIKRAVTEGRR